MITFCFGSIFVIFGYVIGIILSIGYSDKHCNYQVDCVNIVNYSMTCKYQRFFPILRMIPYGSAISMEACDA